MSLSRAVQSTDGLPIYGRVPVRPGQVRAARELEVEAAGSAPDLSEENARHAAIVVGRGASAERVDGVLALLDCHAAREAYDLDPGDDERGLDHSHLLRPLVEHDARETVGSALLSRSDVRHDEVDLCARRRPGERCERL